MEMKVLYRVCKKDTGSTLYEDELFLRVTKAEAVEICQDNFIYEYPERNEEVQKVLARAAKTAQREIHAQRGLRKNQYLLEVELKPAESNLFDNALRRKGGERVAAVGEKRACFVRRSFCRAPQQGERSDSNPQPASAGCFLTMVGIEKITRPVKVGLFNR